jgi:hypothetical protein
LVARRKQQQQQQQQHKQNYYHCENDVETFDLSVEKVFANTFLLPHRKLDGFSK